MVVDILVLVLVTVMLLLVKTCAPFVAMVISLSVNHQFESIAFPTGAVGPPIYLRVWPPKWIEVNLDQKWV